MGKLNSISKKLLLLLIAAYCLIFPHCVEAPAKERAITLPILDALLAKSNMEDELALTTCTDPCCAGCCDESQSKRCGKCRAKCREAICCPKQVTEKTTKHCWKVSSELVCIPGFRWPWEKCRAGDTDCGARCGSDRTCCQPRCGAVRCVNVLERHEYTCEECSYEWEVKLVGTNGCRTHSSTSCPNCGTVCLLEDEVGNEVKLASGQENVETENSTESNSAAKFWHRLLRRN